MHWERDRDRKKETRAYLAGLPGLSGKALASDTKQMTKEREKKKEMSGKGEKCVKKKN